MFYKCFVFTGFRIQNERLKLCTCFCARFFCTYPVLATPQYYLFTCFTNRRLVLCSGMPCHALPCPALPCPAMPCHAMPCHAMPCHAMPCHAMPCHAMPCWILNGGIYISKIFFNLYPHICHAMPCHTMPCHAMPCHAMPCHAMPCHAMPCHAMPCHAMPCHALVFLVYRLQRNKMSIPCPLVNIQFCGVSELVQHWLNNGSMCYRGQGRIQGRKRAGWPEHKKGTARNFFAKKYQIHYFYVYKE